MLFYVSDCPNGFVYINNKCYRWMPPLAIDQHLKKCHLFRGNLLEVSPSNPLTEFVAKTITTLYVADKVYAGFYHRYLIKVDCSPGQFKSAKLKDKEYTINGPIF